MVRKRMMHTYGENGREERMRGDETREEMKNDNKE
jgi:hypothetical protein